MQQCMKDLTHQWWHAPLEDFPPPTTPDERHVLIMQGLVRAYEGWWGFIVNTGQEQMYRYAKNSLGEILGGMGMAPARRGREDGAGTEVGTQTEGPAVNSIGLQAGLEQTVKSIGTQLEAGIGIKKPAMNSVGTQAGVVALQAEQSSVGTPECGYESAERDRGDTPESGYESVRSENGGEGSSVRTYTEAASRTARHRTEPEQKEPPRLAAGWGIAVLARGPERGTTMATPPARRLSQVQPGKSMAQSVVIHGVPTHRKIGKMWGWLQEDNRGVEITGVRWLVKEKARQGKTSSSLVVLLNSRKALDGGEKKARLWMGRRWYQTAKYDWDRKSGVQDSDRSVGAMDWNGDMMTQEYKDLFEELERC